MKPGPWGRVRYTALQIMPVPSAVQELINEPQETKWFVMLPERGQIAAFLKEKGISEATANMLAGSAQPTLDRRGWIVLPSTEQVLMLDEKTRVRLYTSLGQWQENPRHRSPFRIADHAIDAWREMMKMDHETLKLFDQLTYKRGSLTVFTDLPLMLLAMKGKPEIQHRFVRGICSEYTYLATLQVMPDDPINDLVKYWGAGGREEEVRPLIEAAAMASGEIGVPLPLLLPGFPRRTLYTYPDPAEMRFLDCHYTSINFFNKEADLRMLQGLYRDTFFNAFYEEVDAPMRLGDVIVFLSPSGEVVHSATLIAGDLVFTKNGGQRTLPWMLMTLDDTLEYFSTEGQLTLKYYRRKVIEGE